MATECNRCHRLIADSYGEWLASNEGACCETPTASVVESCAEARDRWQQAEIARLAAELARHTVVVGAAKAWHASENDRMQAPIETQAFKLALEKAVGRFLETQNDG